MSTIYYPKLSNIVSLDALPDQLGFIKDGLNNLLSDIHYGDFQHSRNTRGDVANYSLKIVTFKPLEVEIPGTGIFFVLNPDHSAVPGSVSSFPISLSYEWKILGIINDFNLSSFSFEPGDLFQIALSLLDLTSAQLVNNALTYLIDSPTPINSFIDEVNTFYELVPPVAYPVGPTPVEEAILAIESHPTMAGENFGVIIFTAFILDNFNPEDTKRKLGAFFNSFFNGSVEDYILRLITPKIEASLELGAGIKFPRNILVPLNAIGGTPIDAPAQSMLTFTGGTFTFSTETGIGYNNELVTSLPPSQIGNTGFEIEILNAKLDLSQKTNIPEATADGRPTDFVGVFIEKCTVKLPSYFNQDLSSSAAIVGRNLLIGTGGLSGRLGLEGVNPDDPNPAIIKGKFGSGFELSLNSVNLDFKQNVLEGAEIVGGMKIPGFKDASGEDAEIKITINFDSDGDFSVAASEEQGFDLIKIPDILDVNIKSLSVGREQGKFFVALSGSIDFAEQTGSGFIGDNLPKDIEIQKLIIWDDGRIELEGGAIELRKPVSLKIGPVDFSISAIHFGSHEQEHDGIKRQYAFFGFDGGLSIKPGGIDARGDGIKFYFTVDNDSSLSKNLHVFVRIESIAIDLVIPGDASPESAALLLSGYLSMKEPTGDGGGTEYAGGISFTLPKLKMGGSAAMRYNPDVPAFLIDVGFEIPTPIPLGPTGLGIYGFRGLIGSNYVSTKKAAKLPEDAKWYEYYKAKISPDYKEGIQASKFEGKKGFSIGAGVSLATAPDSGKVFSAKVFFLLSLPEVFLIEGQGQLLKERIGLDTTTDPPFYAFIAISPTSVETALGVNYKLPETGEFAGGIVHVTALIEIAFFFGNSLGWYINIGRDLPEEKRVKAKIFSLFEAYFYLMISSSGIKTGAGVSYGFKKRYGPLKAELKAYMDVWGVISFKPIQIGGGIRVGGSVELSLFGIGFGISAEAGLSAEAPKPFMISGYIKVCVKVLWTKACAKISFSWTFEESLNSEEIRLIDANPTNSVTALNIKTEETFELYALEQATMDNPNTWPNIDNYVIPLDSFIDIEFKKGIGKGSGGGLTKIGGTPQMSNTYLIPPKKAKLEQVVHTLTVEDVTINIWNPTTNSWNDYDVYDAITAFSDASIFPDPADASKLKAGFWQEDHPHQCNKLRLLTQTPLNYLVSGNGELRPPQTELFNITTESLFCEDEDRENICINLKDVAWGSSPEKYFPANEWISKSNVLFKVIGKKGKIVMDKDCGLDSALSIQPKERLAVQFPELTSSIDVCIKSKAVSVKVYFYDRVRSQGKNENGQPIFKDRLLKSLTIPAEKLVDGIHYENNAKPVLKMVIVAGVCARIEKPCDPKFTKPYFILGRFLNQLARKKDLTSNFLLNPKKYEAYKGSFFGSALYTTYPVVSKVSYESKVSPFSLTVQIRDEKKFSCEMVLRPLKKRERVNFARIIGFDNLRISPSHQTSGKNYHFLIDAKIRTFRGFEKIVLLGKSCYVLYDCIQENKEDDNRGKVNIEAIKELLAVATKSTLISRRKRINVGKESFPKIFKNSVKSTILLNTLESKNATFSAIKTTNSARYSIVDKSKLNLDVLIQSDEVSDFGKVSKYSNIRVNPESGDDQKTYTYLADAIIGGKTITVNIDALIEFPFRKDIIFNPPSVPPSTGSGMECSGLTEEGMLVGKLVHRMVETQDLFKPSGVFEPDNYTGIFWRDFLYKGKEKAIFFRKTFDSKYKFVFNFIDKNKYDCFLSIEILHKEFTLYQVVGFKNLRIDPTNTTEGVHYSFLVTAIVYTGYGYIEIECKGSSCYPINSCTKETCDTRIFKICYLTQADYLWNENKPTQVEINEDTDGMFEGLNKLIQPIFRPNSIFSIKIKTKDSLSVSGSVSGFPKNYDKTFHFGFKTGGGVGFFHNFLGKNNVWKDQQKWSNLLAKDQEDSFKLNVLNHYIDYKNSYPNADGRLTNAKPLFYIDPSLLLFFKDQYVFIMFRNWAAYAGNEEVQYELEASIKDPVDSLTSPSPIIVGAAWDSHDTPYIDQDVSIINSMMQPDGFDAPIPCVTTQTVTSIGVNTVYDIPELKPLKAYTAIFNAKYKKASDVTFDSREVHRFIFQTSRYGDFEEQIYSYRLLDESLIVGEALFDVAHEVNPADLLVATSILNGSMAPNDPLVLKHADKLDRLLSGAFKLTSLQAAVTTEFNVIKNGTTILGILIRNPEPFNDPKMPASVLNDTIRLSINSGSTALHQVIFSSDNASAFVTNSNHSLNLGTGDYRFTFLYKQYNGEEYITVDTINDVDLTIN